MSIQRDRGLRQCVNRKNKHQEMGCSREMFKPEKNGLIYILDHLK